MAINKKKWLRTNSTLFNLPSFLIWKIKEASSLIWKITKKEITLIVKVTLWSLCANITTCHSDEERMLLQHTQQKLYLSVWYLSKAMLFLLASADNWKVAKPDLIPLPVQKLRH